MRGSVVQVTISKLAMFLPDWNSLDSVRRTHNFLEISALALFALLVLFDVLSHLSKKNERRAILLERIALGCFAAAVLAEIGAYVYGHRNDTLSEQVIRSLDTTARDAAQNSSTALSDSGIALSNSKEAKTKSETALRNSKEAGTKSTDAVGKATKAQDRTDEVEKKADNLNGQLKATQEQLKSVQSKRAELETAFVNLAICNAPRVLPQWVVGGHTSADPLKPYAPYQAIVDFVPNDAEARRAALEIEALLTQAGWKVIPTPTAGRGGFADGVEVQPFNGPPEGSTVGAQFRSNERANAVVDFLHSYNWQADLKPPLDEHGSIVNDPKIIPPETLSIRVGLYPAVSFVVPPGESYAATVMAQIKRKNEEWEKESEQQRLKTREEHFATLTPQEIVRYNAQLAQSDQERELDKRRYSNPCKPLNPLVVP
jgi:hypothetical protein